MRPKKKKRKRCSCSTNLKNLSKTVTGGNFTRKQSLTTSLFVATSRWCRRTTPRTRCGSVPTYQISITPSRWVRSIVGPRCIRLRWHSIITLTTRSGCSSMIPRRRSRIKPPIRVRTRNYLRIWNVSWASLPNSKLNSVARITFCLNRSLRAIYRANRKQSSKREFLDVLTLIPLWGCLATVSNSTSKVNTKRIPCQPLAKCINQFTSFAPKS